MTGVSFFAKMEGQTIEEWTQQDKVKVKRLTEQIAANKVYIEFAQTGVKIVSKGLDVVGQIKDGDLMLHVNYFDSLFVSNAAIRNSGAVKEIISSYFRLIRIRQQFLRSLPKLQELTEKEINYCRNVFDLLLSSCAEDVQQLKQILNSVAGDEFYTMTDDERIMRIDILQEETRRKLAFAYSFSTDIKMLAMHRVAEAVTIEHSKLLR
jgi:hypothetical protein